MRRMSDTQPVGPPVIWTKKRYFGRVCKIFGYEHRASAEKIFETKKEVVIVHKGTGKALLIKKKD